MPHLVKFPTHTQGPMLACVASDTLPRSVHECVAGAVIFAANGAFGNQELDHIGWVIF